MADHYFSQAMAFDSWSRKNIIMEKKNIDRNIFSILEVFAEMLHSPVFSYYLEMTNPICQQLILPCLLAFLDFCCLFFS